MATPTISGAKEMLKYLGANPKSKASAARKVILTDLREEAVVYIKGTPFVLRELNKPYDTLKHVGITGPVVCHLSCTIMYLSEHVTKSTVIQFMLTAMQVEHMEARLKEDIITEIRQSGGLMLFHREEYNPSTSQSNVVGYWENILVDDVKTTVEVYSALKDEGYDIVYRRIPLTRERDALASDVDAIQCCKDEYVFLFPTTYQNVFRKVYWYLFISVLTVYL
jgi:hypothetical protein